MPSTNSLLSVVRLKKYFPVSKALFSKNRRYLRACENMSLEIAEGETFSLVGESGCGKSTFGRTLLQLYRPTKGEVIYFGASLEEVKPKYAFEILKNAETYQAEYAQNPSLDEYAHSLEFFSALRVLGGLVCLPKEECKRGAKLLVLHLRAPSIQTEQAVSAFLQGVEKTAEFTSLEQRKGGVDLAKLSVKELRNLRKHLQIIFQDPYSSLNPRMTVGQLIEEGLATHGLYKRGTDTMREEVLSVMKKCGLQSDALHRYPHQFSGGQRQRICIARALALKPKFIVCDECVSALDASVQSQILNLLSELKEKEKLTYLFISHDLSVVRYISDKIGVMYLGELVETGSAKSVFENPRHPYTISLMSAVPSVKTRKSERIILQGHMPSPVAPPSGCKFHTRCFMACERCKSGKVPVLEVEKGHFVACHFAKLSTQEKRKLAKDRENG